MPVDRLVMKLSTWVEIMGPSRSTRGFGEWRERVYPWGMSSCSESAASGAAAALDAQSQAPDLLARWQAEHEARLAAERELSRANAANEAKTRFLSTMSHEIRTPLNGVVGMVELLRETRLDREQSGYVDTLSQSAEALLSIVNEVIDLSIIDSGQLEREQRPFSPLRLAQDTMALVRPHAQAKGLTLLLWCGELPPQVVGEPTRLQQVWMNLLSNAIKFTDRGEVRFDLQAEAPLPTDSGTAQIRLRGRVSDTGRGIEREHQRRIAEAFSRSDITTPPGATGSGLGLSIASRLVRLLGGELTLESEPGVGSRFGFSIQAELPDLHPASVRPEAQSAAPLETLRVLVAEDNQINQLLAMTVLAKFGIQARLARDGLEAVELARAAPFDVILMDVQMPRMDGIEATRAIRQIETEGHPRPWIIAVTANAFDQDRERCLAAGMDDFVSKPFRQEALRDALMQSTRVR